MKKRNAILSRLLATSLAACMALEPLPAYAAGSENYEVNQAEDAISALSDDTDPASMNETSPEENIAPDIQAEETSENPIEESTASPEAPSNEEETSTPEPSSSEEVTASSNVETTSADDSSEEEVKVIEKTYNTDVNEYPAVTAGNYTASITNGGDYAYYRFTPTSSGKLLVYSTANTDTYGYLYDGSLNPLTHDDDSGSGSNFKYTYTVEAGVTYIIGIKYYSGSNTGDIPFTVEFLGTDTNGWTTFDGTKYYISNGQFANGLTEIDSDLYYFTNGAASTLTYILVDDDYYAFDNEGKAISNDWYSNRYFGADHKAVKGLQEIDGNTYYFDDNCEKVTNTTITVDNTMYYFGSSGVLEQTLDADTEGWTTLGSDTFYIEDGSLVTGLKTISGNLYYFNNSGVLQKNTSSMSISYNGSSHYYMFGSDGKAVSGWAEYSGYTYYYDPATHYGASGLTTIAGDKYYFTYDGRLYTDYEATIDGSFYYFGSDGKLVDSFSLSNDGWHTVNGTSYYVYQGRLANGELTISGDTYYFSSGKFRTNYRGASSGNRYKYYGEDGKLITSAWYKYSSSDYYADADGYNVVGINLINGNYYYFSSYGTLQKNTTVTINETSYSVDGNGIITDFTLSDSLVTMNGSTYGFVDGKQVCGGVYTINGHMYLFDAYGRLCTNEGTYSFSKNDKYHYYRINSDGNVVIGWYETSSYPYYYLPNGEAAQGVVEIDGKYYYFSDGGYLYYKNTTFSIYNSSLGKSLYYRAKEDGSLVIGWYESGSSRYYYQEDGSAACGVVTIDGQRYYFSNNGRLEGEAAPFSSPLSISESNKVRFYIYTADSNGYIQLKWSDTGYNDISITDENGNGYGNYYNNSTATFQTVTGKTYYIRISTGNLSKTYTLTATTFNTETDGWKSVNGDWYYIESGQFVKNCLKKIGSYTYGFDSNGVMYKNSRVYISGNYYAFDNSGHMITNNWYGDYYYGQNGISPNGILEVEDHHYYFSNGEPRKNSSFSIYNDATEKYDYYRTDSNGYLIKGWVNNYSSTYYYGDDFKAASGLTVIDGKTYYFDESNCQMYKNTVYYDGTKLYYLGEDGVLVQSVSATSDGWKSLNNCWYYIKDGAIVKNTIIKVGSYYYGFSSSGVMLSDCVQYLKNPTTGIYSYQGFDSSGHMLKNGWYTFDGYRYYFDSNGAAPGKIASVDGVLYYFYNGHLSTYSGTSSEWISSEGRYRECRYDSESKIITGWYGDYYYLEDGWSAYGIVEIDSAKYLFDEYGRIRKDLFYEKGGVVYYFGTDGKLAGTVNVSSDGWKKLNGEWFYVSDGFFVKDSILKIGSYTYGFDSVGMMITNNVATLSDAESDEEHCYGFDSSGHMVTGYSFINGKWYYFDSTGKGTTGIRTISDKTYLFIDGVKQYDKYFTDDSKIYYFGQNGVLVKSVSITTNGWKNVNGKWYYVKDGILLRNQAEVQIGAKTYAFDNNGQMRTDTVVYYNGNYSVYDTDGYMVKGWYTTSSGSTYYTDNNGHTLSGLQEIDGSIYWFEPAMVKNSTYSYYASDLHRDVYTRFGANGKAITGWYSEDNSHNRYYYDAKGKSVSGVVTIDGTIYCFDNYGKMLRNTYYQSGDKLYYCNDIGNASVNCSTSGTGWKKLNGEWFYTEKGVLASGLKTIGSHTYYFDPDTGIMLTNSVAYISGSYYRFDSNGYMITGWYRAGEIAYYYGTDGKNVSGLQKIDNKIYYFDHNGYLMNSCIIAEDNTIYSFDTTGNNAGSVSFANDGWHKITATGQWFYSKDGKLVKDTVATISGKTYGFNSDGVMITDRTYSFDSDVYHFDTSGVAVTGWYEDVSEYFNHRYYFNSDGKAAKGLVTLNSHTYYFDDYGKMGVNTTVVIDGIPTVINSFGYVTGSVDVSTNGWKKLSGDYYYVASGKVVTSTLKTIGGVNYYFDRTGRMASDESVEIAGKQYRFNASGAMYKGWYKDSYGDTYYYGSDGAAVSGLNTIDSKKYYFSNNNVMQTNCAVFTKTAVYYLGNDGTVTQTLTASTDGWKKISATGAYYYAINGSFYKNGFLTVGNVIYYFNKDGVMAANTTIKLRNNNDSTSSSYRFKASGAMVTGWFTDTDGNKYYYFDDGKAATGKVTISGTDYYFDSFGKAINPEDAVSPGTTNVHVKDTPTLYPYYATKSGILNVESNSSYDTYGYLYDENMNILTSNDDGGSGGNFKLSYLVEAGKTYYIGAGMYSYDSGKEYSYDISISFADTAVPVVDGADGWKSANGNWYYKLNGTLLTNTVKTIKGVTYYFDNTGKMVTDQAVQVRNALDGTYYYYRFDSAGKMITGWYQETPTSDRYYYDSLGHAVSGTTVIDGKEYYFSSDGRVITNATFLDEGDFYGDDGLVDFKVDLTVNGWQIYSNHRYYVNNGRLVKYCWMNIDGTDYYFGSDGAYCNRTQNLLCDDGQYHTVRFDTNGKLVTGWYNSPNGGRYYYDAKGYAVTGLKSIDGKKYYFAGNDGRMSIDTTIHDKSNLYYINELGVVTETVSLSGTGFKTIKATNSAYYTDNGIPAVSTFLTVNGHTYYFGEDGVMYRDRTAYINDYHYRFDENGYMCTGWVGNYYYQSDGRGANGIVKLSDGTYCFTNGLKTTDSTYKEAGIVYYFGNDGKLSGSFDISVNGWHKLNGSYYYSKDKQLYTDTWATINSKQYYFGYNGRMYSDTITSVRNEDDSYSTYCFSVNGDIQKNVWVGDRYFGADGKALTGLQTISGSQYYFNPTGTVAKGTTIAYNGKVYSADISGIVTTSTKTGWMNDDEYAESGKLVTGWKKINNQWYYFNSNFRKISSDTLTLAGKTYYFSPSGVMLTGWIKTGADSIRYADSNGVLSINKWQKIDNVWYYFDSYGYAAVGEVVIGGKKNLFANDGAWIGDSFSDGWRKVSTYYYYVKNGRIVTNTDMTIGGKLYSFDSLGRMRSDISYGQYYYGNDGSAVKSKWILCDNNKYRYYNADGVYLSNGIFKIGTTYYSFDGNGYMRTDSFVSDNGYYYDIAKSGKTTETRVKMSEGWNVINGNTYYLKSGELLTGKQTIDGKTYVFNTNGIMYYDTYVYVDNTYVLLDKNGVMVTKGWYTTSYGSTYYVGNDGRLVVDGLQTINGKQYYFNFSLKKYSVVDFTSNTLYDIDSNGVVIKTVPASGSKWVKDSSGSYFYSLNGRYLSWDDGLVKIGSALYKFDEFGQLMTNRVVPDSSSILNYHQYFASSSGSLKIADGWINNIYFINGDYADSYEYIISGKYYYLDYGLNVKGVFLVGDGYYYYDGNGTKTKVTLNEGWNTISGKKYYVKNGSMSTGTRVIDGKVYCFGTIDHSLATNILYDYMFFGSDGTPIKSQWKDIDGHTYYFDSNGKYVTGKQVIGGTTYIFNSSGWKI